jgi:hypothetical protein
MLYFVKAIHERYWLTKSVAWMNKKVLEIESSENIPSELKNFEKSELSEEPSFLGNEELGNTTFSRSEKNLGSSISSYSVGPGILHPLPIHIGSSPSNLYAEPTPLELDDRLIYNDICVHTNRLMERFILLHCNFIFILFCFFFVFFLFF